MKKFTIDELYHRVFKDCPGEPFPYEPGSVIEEYELCVCDIGKATYPHSCRDFETADTLTIVCPEVPSGTMMVAVTGDEGCYLVRFPDNTYYYLDSYVSFYENEDGHTLTGKQDLIIHSVNHSGCKLPYCRGGSFETAAADAAEEIGSILTEHSLWWHRGGMPGNYRVELFNKVDTGKFSDIGSLKEIQIPEEHLPLSMAGKTITEIKFVLHPDIIVPTNDGKD